MSYHIPDPDVRAKMVLTKIEEEYKNRDHSDDFVDYLLQEKINFHCELICKETKFSKRLRSLLEKRPDDESMESLMAWRFRHYQRIAKGCRLTEKINIDGTDYWLSIVGEGSNTEKERHATKKEAEMVAIKYNQDIVDKVNLKIEKIRREKHGAANH